MIGSYHFSSDILPLLLSAAMMLVLAVYAWRHRGVAGATPFALSASLVVLANSANALELASDDLALMTFWRQVWFALMVPQGLTSLALALEYAGVKRVTRRSWALLGIIPFVALLLMLTNDAHHLIWTQVWFDGGLLVSRGIWNWLLIGYSYLLRVVSFIVFAWVFVRSHGIYRWQSGVLGFAGSLIWVGMALRILGIDLFPAMDDSIVGALLSSPITAWGLFRFRTFDLAPVARDTVIEHMGDGMIVLDTQNRIVDLNPAAQNLLAIRAEAIGQDAARVLGRSQNLIEMARDTGARDSQIAFEATGKWYAARTLPLTDSRGAAIGRLIVLHDMTELHQAQTNLLAQQRARAGLEERERLARELHDDLGQTMGFVSTQAQAIRKLLSKGETARADDCLARLVEVAQEADADIRDSIFGLRSLGSLEQGFVAAVEQYVQRFSKNYGIQVAFRVESAVSDDALGNAVEAQLLRIIQEALSNARKHAQARGVRVTLAAQDGCAQVVIEDDGQGFEPAEVSSNPGQRFGLRFMQERAEAVGGRLAIQSARDQGTRLVIQVPLRRSIHESAAG